MKKYKAIFFDWDGTAVTSRKAPVTDIIQPMKSLLQQGISLIIVSGTTYENIAEGQLHTYFTPEELGSLYLGLGRGAYNYSFTKEGKPYVFADMIPDADVLEQIHSVCFDIHKKLLRQYGINTDIVFSRPNYCKIDLMVDNNRGEQLFFQENELVQLEAMLNNHHFHQGSNGLITLAEGIGKAHNLPVTVTSDAKYLEVGISSKSNNVNTILKHLNEKGNIQANDCSFWGDEYTAMGDAIYGSDSFMITKATMDGDFFDVSTAGGRRPANVKVIGGGVTQFLDFLQEEITISL